MVKIIWTDPALSDLTEIADYIALDNFNASQKLVKKVFSNVEYLELCLENSDREITVGPCRVFYRHDQNNVYILYVMRGERQLRKYLIDNRLKKI